MHSLVFAFSVIAGRLLTIHLFILTALDLPHSHCVSAKQCCKPYLIYLSSDSVENNGNDQTMCCPSLYNTWNHISFCILYTYLSCHVVSSTYRVLCLHLNKKNSLSQSRAWFGLLACLEVFVALSIHVFICLCGCFAAQRQREHVCCVCSVYVFGVFAGMSLFTCTSAMCVSLLDSPLPAL